MDAAVDRRRTDDSDRLVHQAVSKASGQPRTAAKPKSSASASTVAKTVVASKPRGKTLSSSTTAKGSRNQPSSQPSFSRGGFGKKSKKGGKR